MKYSALLMGFVTLVAGCSRPNIESDDNVSTISIEQTILVATDTLAATLPVDGTIESRQQATISTRMMARIAAVNVDVGTRVANGQVLLTLGTEDTEADRTKAEAALSAASAARDQAAKHAARMDTLYAQDVVPLVQRDQAHLNLTVAESQLSAAMATVSQVESAEGYSEIRAPFSGAVVRRHVNAGDLAVPGAPLLEIIADGPREAVFSIPPELTPFIEIGSEVTVHAGSFGDAEATVRAIASGADVRSRTVEVRALLPTSWPTGVAVTVFVPNGSRAVVSVPETAIVRRGQLTGVRVRTESGEMLRWVRLGRRFEAAGADETFVSRVEVLAGLESGERILP